jgi:ribonuclease D
MAKRTGSSRKRSDSAQRKSARTYGGKTRMITTQADLETLCAELRTQSSFAFDTEFVMEDVYRPEVCVVQLATERLTAVVDPFQVDDLAPVWALVADENIEVIVHAGMEDLAICQEQGGQTPRNVFDCQLACGLVTTDFPLSLARLTRFLLGVRLHKSQTLTDWRKRPLTDAQVEYAADDVRYLPAARRALARKLEKTGRTEWAAEEMARFHQPETYVRGPDEKVLKLKGAGSLDGQGLAVAAELVKARSRLAAQYNRPARVVVRDHLLVEIARHRWTESQDIRTLRGINLKPAALRDLGEAVRRGEALPPEAWPTPAPVDDESEAEAALAMLVGAVLRSRCADLGIAHQLVATRKDIRAFVRVMVRGLECAASIALCAGWRKSQFGDLLRGVLAGDRSVAVAGSRGHPRIVVQPPAK